MTQTSRPRNAAFVAVLMAGMIGQSLLFSVVTPALPAIVAASGPHGETIAQLTVALPSLGLILAGFAAGALIDPVGPRPAILGGMALYAICGALPLLFGTPQPLLASRLLLGFASGIITTAASVLLVARYEGEARGRMFGYQVSSGSALGLVALIAAGAIVSHHGWQASFLIYGLAMAVFLALGIASVPAVRPVRAAESGSFRATITRLWPVYLAGGLLFVVPVTGGAQLPFLLTAHGTTDALVQSVVIAMTTLGSMTSAALFGRIEKAIGPRRTLALSLGLGAVGLALIGTAASPIAAGLGSLLSGVGVGLYMSYLWLVAAVLPPAELQARGLALLSTAMFLGGFLYPLLFTPLAILFGIGGAFLAMAAAMAVGSAAALLVPRGRLLLN